MSLPVLLFDLRTRRTVELDRPEARQARALHRFALLDPPLTLELVPVAWWSMQFDHDAPRDQPRMIGPAVRPTAPLRSNRGNDRNGGTKTRSRRQGCAPAM